MSHPEPGEPLTYAASGVSIDAGERTVQLLGDVLTRTHRPGVLGGIGGFAGLFALDTGRYRQPVLASSTDGVGTKLAIARAMDKHDTVGIDLVAMVVDDLVVCGAEPLFLQDYIACATVVPEQIAAIVTGIAAGCVQAGCALLGGETAEHGDQMRAGEYDLAATGVGVVEADRVLDGAAVRPGDVVVALASTGLHSNGYSLARRALLDRGRLRLSDSPAELGRTLGEELLEPTRIYAQDCLALAAETDLRAMAHITGGGIAGNLVRVLPHGLDAVVSRSTWTLPAIFDLIARYGDVPVAEMEHAFNLGIGMMAVVSPHDADRALALLTARHVPAWVAGEIVASPDPGCASAAHLTGAHPA